jgi:arylsulfatase A-like enzyme
MNARPSGQFLFFQQGGGAVRLLRMTSSLLYGLKWIALGLALALGFFVQPLAKEQLNFVIIFTDDQGYGDMSCNGHPTIHTPHLDRMAHEGQKWTQFYSSAPVCTPSRAALMTGRLPVRSGMASSKRVVLFPDSAGGLPQSEITVAEVLKGAGYNTAMVGKWHMGHLPRHLPTTQGFDSYYGIPYSNDMDRDSSVKGNWVTIGKTSPWSIYKVPLLQNEKEIERPVNQNTITRRYTQQAVKFINENKEKPFFLYLAHSMPHIPLYASKKFEGKSLNGIYGDVIEEIDWSVGEVLNTLRKQKLHQKTIVLFTSDNGPWEVFKTHGGSAGLLRGAKGGTREGGMREPAIFWGPGNVKSGVVQEMGSTLDVLPTFASLAGAKSPDDRAIDGYDLSDVLLNHGKSPRKGMFYFGGAQLSAVRSGNYKAQFREENGINPKPLAKPELYHLGEDPSEKYDLAAEHPEIVERLAKLGEELKDTVKPVPDQLVPRVGR